MLPVAICYDHMNHYRIFNILMMVTLGNEASLNRVVKCLMDWIN